MFSPIAWPRPLRQRAVELALDDHVIEHVAAVVDRGVARDRHLAGVADRSPPRRHGSRSGRSAASRSVVLVSRSSAISPLLFISLARVASSNSEIRRSVPTTSKRAVLVVDVGSRRLRAPGGDGLALGEHGVDGLHHRAAGGDRRARRRPTRSPRSRWRKSPWRCTICSAEMPSRSATTRGNTVAWPWPVDCTLSARIEPSPPGNCSAAPSSGAPPECSSTQEMPRPRSLPAA